LDLWGRKERGERKGRIRRGNRRKGRTRRRKSKGYGGRDRVIATPVLIPISRYVGLVAAGVQEQAEDINSS